MIVSIWPSDTWKRNFWPAWIDFINHFRVIQCNKEKANTFISSICLCSPFSEFVILHLKTSKKKTVTSKNSDVGIRNRCYLNWQSTTKCWIENQTHTENAHILIYHLLRNRIHAPVHCVCQRSQFCHTYSITGKRNATEPNRNTFCSTCSRNRWARFGQNPAHSHDNNENRRGTGQCKKKELFSDSI